MKTSGFRASGNAGFAGQVSKMVSPTYDILPGALSFEDRGGQDGKRKLNKESDK